MGFLRCPQENSPFGRLNKVPAPLYSLSQTDGKYCKFWAFDRRQEHMAFEFPVWYRPLPPPTFKDQEVGPSCCKAGRHGALSSHVGAWIWVLTLWWIASSSHLWKGRLSRAPFHGLSCRLGSNFLLTVLTCILGVLKETCLMTLSHPLQRQVACASFVMRCTVHRESGCACSKVLYKSLTWLFLHGAQLS